MDEPTPEKKKAVGKMMAKVAGQSLITDAECAGSYIYNSSKCRARVRIYVNRKLGGNWTQCSKNRRPGKMTCHWHGKLEDES